MLSDMVLAAGLEPIEILQAPKAGLLMLARKR